MDDCIFCKIIKGDIPSYKIYEDDKTYAFLDIAGDFEGHTLVVPKAHAADLIACPEGDLAAVFATARKLAKHFIEDCGFDGANLVNCTREAGQQSVFHFHVHVIPRRNGDGANVFNTRPDQGYDLASIAKKLALKA